MGMLRILVVIFCIFVGAALTVTVIGAIIWLPMMAIGIYLAYKEQREHGKRAIRDALVEAEEIKKKKEKEEEEK